MITMWSVKPENKKMTLIDANKRILRQRKTEFDRTETRSNAEELTPLWDSRLK